MRDKRTVARKREAFLRVLKTHGNVQLAARRAGIDRSWFYKQRKKSPAFLDGWLRAVEAGREALASGKTQPEGELVVWNHKSGKSQLVRIKAAGKRWTPHAEATFLEHLATTANVSESAAEAGFSTTTTGKRRAASPRFAAEWDEALAEGYARIELMIVEHATASLTPGKTPRGKAAMPPMTAAEIMNLLKLHQASVKGAGHRFGRLPREPNIEEVRAEILRKVAAIEAARNAIDAKSCGNDLLE